MTVLLTMGLYDRNLAMKNMSIKGFSIVIATDAVFMADSLLYHNFENIFRTGNLYSGNQDYLINIYICSYQSHVLKALFKYSRFELFNVPKNLLRP